MKVDTAADPIGVRSSAARVGSGKWWAIDGVVLARTGVSRAGVDDGLSQARYLVQQPMVGRLGDGVGRHQAQAGVRAHLDVCQQLVSHPSDADGVHTFDAVARAQHALHAVDEARVDAVHEPPVDLA